MFTIFFFLGASVSVTTRDQVPSLGSRTLGLPSPGKLYSWGPSSCFGMCHLVGTVSQPQQLATPELYMDGGFRDFAAGEHQPGVLVNF
jgi:hypothetical protein